MRSPIDLDHYDLLDVARDAPQSEVERAYRMACATWEQGSLATYSLYGDVEVEALRERIDQAFAVLSDPESRAAYDRSLASGAPGAESALSFDLELGFAEPPRAELEPAAGLEFAETLEEDGAPWDGARLRRNRLQRGIELEQIARVTKVSQSYLRFLEEENFESLPAPVYVRGFLTAYARCLGLEPGRVVPDFMERLESAVPAEAPPAPPFRTPVRRRGRR